MFQQNGGFSRYSAYLRSKQQRTRIRRLLTFLLSFFIILGVFSIIGFGSVSLAGEAMAPAYGEGYRLIYSPYPYGIGIGGKRYFSFSSPKRGDPVLIRPAYNGEIAWWRSGVDAFTRLVSFQQLELEDLIGIGQGDPWLVRRVIGLPGDTVYVESGWCFIKPRDRNAFIREDELSERVYEIATPPKIAGWRDRYPGPATLSPLVLKEGEYFLLSDNRAIADDSRLWGPVKKRAILARILLRFWPLPGQA